MQVKADLWRRTLEQLRACGAGRRECVAYWLGPAGDGSVLDELVHPAHRASIGHYELDQAWLNGFWDDLALRGRSVFVQVHTHAGSAFHSKTDDDFPLIYTSGFLSLVVPGFAMMDPKQEDLFLAQLQADGVFREVKLDDHLKGIR